MAISDYKSRPVSVKVRHTITRIENCIDTHGAALAAVRDGRRNETELAVFTSIHFDSYQHREWVH